MFLCCLSYGRWNLITGFIMICCWMIWIHRLWCVLNLNSVDYCSTLEGDQSYSCWQAYFELKDLEVCSYFYSLCYWSPFLTCFVINWHVIYKIWPSFFSVFVFFTCIIWCGVLILLSVFSMTNLSFFMLCCICFYFSENKAFLNKFISLLEL